MNACIENDFARSVLVRFTKSLCANASAVALGIVMLGSVFLLWGCTKSPSAGEKQLYTCGMHPNVIADKPGNCPICGMKLTPIRKGAQAPADSTISIDPLTAQNMDIRTDLVRRGPLRHTVRTVGIVDFDET